MKIFLLYLFVSLFPATMCSQGVWTQKANCPGISRYDAMSFEIGTKGYIIGGFDGGSTFLKDVWEYDAINNSWTQKQDFISTRWMGISFSIGTNGYVGTGQGGGYKNDWWEYDPLADSWTQKAILPAPVRAAGTGFSINGKGYIGLGFDGNIGQRYKDWWEYNPVSNTWTQKANFYGGKRNFATGFSLLGKGYVGTGRDSTTIPLEDFWEYDPSLDIWVQKTNFLGGKRADIDGSHFIIGNYGYIGAGWNQSTTTYYNDFWKYDPVNDIWAPIPNLSGSIRMGASGFSIDSKGYIGMGVIINNTCFNDLWEYDTTTVGITETKSNSTVSVYPNPFFLYTTFTFNPAQKNTVLKLFDAQGKEIKRVDIPSGAKDFLLKKENLESGVYFYRILSENKTIASGKLVVQ